ncbi:hypothetical protein BGZ50_000174 [Haplosporangium sp. Z 11]|nr:hypothetical protein BGZ50_000174 [Haplosporangium sp. Z 11]
MVFVNGQKFACATCIKGHRSTSCNHGERPLHEIKKKGRPSTQCMHCKELRKAKQVHVRCLCGREEGTSAGTTGAKWTKSMSHDGHILTSARIGGEDLLRSLSADSSSPKESTDSASPCSDARPCTCLEGGVCICCRDREGHVVVKPSKSSSRHNMFSNYPSRHQRSTTSLDFIKTTSTFIPLHMQGPQMIQSPEESACSNIGVNGTFTGLRISDNNNSASPTAFTQISGSGSERSPSLSSPTCNQQDQLQSQLCFDYTSSSEYESDHCNPVTSYPYFPQAVDSYALNNDTSNIAEGDAAMTQGIRSRLTPMNSMLSEDAGALYSPLSTHLSDTSSPMPISSMQTGSTEGPTFSAAIPTTTKSCCKSSQMAPSTALSSVQQSNSSGESSEAQRDPGMGGCGCAISASMCCCGELCACPGCLAYPNNQNALKATFSPATLSSNATDADGSVRTLGNSMNISQPAMAASPAPKGPCCGSSRNTAIGVSNLQAVNLSQALSLIEANSQNGTLALSNDVRQALRESLNTLGQSGMEPVKMQHPTLLGDNGVLICGCGCGRPTVDCADCFRDMCEFVGESQARMMKDELEYEMAMNREGGYLADLGLNMNMTESMNVSLSMDMDMGMNMGMDEDVSQPSEGAQRIEAPSSAYEQQQQQQDERQRQEISSMAQSLYQEKSSNPNETPDQHQRNAGPTLGPQQDQNQSGLNLEQEQILRMRLQLLEQEQMRLSQLQPSNLNNLQLDFLDDEDWSFVDEIRTDGPGHPMPAV